MNTRNRLIRRTHAGTPCPRAPDLALLIAALALLLAAATALRAIGLLGPRRKTRPATSTEREPDHVRA